MSPPPAYTQPISAAVCHDKLIAFFTALFSFWTLDDIAAPFRIILTAEQLRDEQMFRLFVQYIVQNPMNRIQKALAFLPAEKAATLTVRFYSLMFFYCTLYDGASKKDVVLPQFQKQISLLAEEAIK